MNISGLDIQPVLLYLPDTQEWVDKWNEMKKHLDYCGVFGNVISIPGVHAEKFGIIGTHAYELDKPGGGHMILPKYVGSFLSMYVIYNVCNNLPNSHFMIMEGDTRFSDGWFPKIEKALSEIPSDFDFLFVGSCCAMDKKYDRVKDNSNVFKFRRMNIFPVNYPMGGNCYIVAKKCLNHIIATQRDCYTHADISLGLHSFPNLDVFAILPRICEQLHNENLPQ